MKKPRSYAPYIFSVLLTAFNVTTNNLWLKSGLIPYFIFMFLVIAGLWHLIVWLLTLSEHFLVRCGYVLLGSILYSICALSLDKYILHVAISFTGFNISDSVFRLLFIALFATFLIERTNWARAREKAKIENLRLQAENIESKFQLLREQVNPEFLFHCLKTLKTMVRANDAKIEDYILKLADVYRQILKKQNNAISLREELALLQSYVFLMRYGREAAIRFEIDVSDESLYYDLPIFALQWLCDNSIKQHDFSENQPLHIRVFQKDAQSITLSHNYAQKTAPLSINREQLDMRYAHEGIEDGVLIEQNESTYSTTIKLF